MDQGNENGTVLFEVQSPESYSQHFDFQLFAMLYRNNIATVIIKIWTVLFVVSAAVSAVNGRFADAAYFLLALAAVHGIMLIVMHHNAKKHMDSPLSRQNVNRFLFYQEHFVNTDINSQAAVRYVMLVCAYETKNYFYLFPSNDRAYIIEKSHFIYNTPAEMRRLLQIKLGYRFYLKTK